MNYRNTSREAYQALAPVSGNLDRAILRVLAAERAGLTCEQIEERIGRSHQAVSGNLRHLVERGLVTESGSYTKTKSGRRAIVWRVINSPTPTPEDDWIARRDEAMRKRAESEAKEREKNLTPDLFG